MKCMNHNTKFIVVPLCGYALTAGTPRSPLSRLVVPGIVPHRMRKGVVAKPRGPKWAKRILAHLLGPRVLVAFLDLTQTSEPYGYRSVASLQKSRFTDFPSFLHSPKPVPRFVRVEPLVEFDGIGAR